MKLDRDRLGGCLLLLLATTYALQIQHIDLLPVQRAAAMTARTLPSLYAALLAAGALWLLVRPVTAAAAPLDALHWRRGLAFILLMCGFAVCVRPAGFLLASIVFLASGFKLLGARHPLRVLGAAVCISVAMWALLTVGLGVYLPAWPSFAASA